MSQSFSDGNGGAEQESLIYGGMGQRTDQLIQATDSTGEEQYTYTHLGLTATRAVTQMKRA